MIKKIHNILNIYLLNKGLYLPFIVLAWFTFLSGETKATSYSSSAVTQITTAVTAGATDQQVLRIAVTTSGGGAGLHICSMSFVMNNSTTPDNAKLYYTGSSSTFATTTQLGSTVASPTGTIQFTFDQSHGSGSTWYYWLAYDIPAGAPDCSTFDASFATSGLTYGSSCPGASSTTPSTPDPTGLRTLEAPGCWNYCSVSGSLNTAGELTGVKFNTINRTSTYDGYINTGLSTTVYTGVDYALTLTRLNNSTYNLYTAAWIDFNNDGDFADAGENVMVSTVDNTTGSVARTVTVSIPGGAYIGTTKMRTVMKYNATLVDACDAYSTYIDWEDYDITIASPTACAGTPSTPTIAISNASGCVSEVQSITVTNFDINDALTYQWMTSNDGGTTWSNLGSSTSIHPLATVTSPAILYVTPTEDLQYRLNVTCTNSFQTAVSNTVSYTASLSSSCYCQNTYTTGTTYYILNVTLETLNNTTSNTCPSMMCDYTSGQTVPTLIIGGTHDIQFTVDNGATTSDNYVYFDWNQDGDFADAGENYTLGQAPATGPTTLGPNTFVVPGTALSGYTVMRIQTIRTGDAQTVCRTGAGYGETEDYMVYVRAANPGSAYGIYIDELGATTTNIVDCEVVSLDGIKVGSQDGDENYAVTYISSMKDITVDNISCINVSMTVSTAEASPDWTGSDAPLTGAGSPQTVTYTTVGRKSVTLLPQTSFNEVIYEEDFEGSASGWTGQATSLPGSTQNYWMMGRSGGSSKTGWYTASCASCGANNTVLTGTYSPRIVYIKTTNPSAGVYCNYSTVGTATTDLRLYSPAFSTTGLANATLTFNYVGSMNANDNVQLQYSTDGAAWTNIAGELYNSAVSTTTQRVVALPAGALNQATLYIGWNFNSTTAATSAPPSFIIDDIQVYTTTNLDNIYTDFLNFTMSKPASGSVSGVAEACSNIENEFTSSEAGTPGYTYLWSTSNPAGVSATIATTTASATGITFNNTTTGDLVSTVTLNITSGCCGPLDPVTTTVTVHPLPTSVTVDNVSPSNCLGGSYTMNVTPTTAGITYTWYDAASAGNVLGTGTSYTETSTPSGSTSYYVEATSASGCVNPVRTTVTLSSTDTPPTGIDLAFCSNGTFTMQVNDIDNTTFKWYDAVTGGSLLGTGTTYDFNVTCTPSCTASVWVSATTGDCSESSRDQVDVVLTAPTPPTTWQGDIDSDWFNQNNWDQCVPECGLNALLPANPLPAGAQAEPTISFANGGIAYTQSITVSADRTLTFGDVKARLEICGDLTHNGSVVMASKGTIAFTSTSASQVYTNTTADEYYTVEINNTHSTPTVDIAANDMTIASNGFLNLVNGVITTAPTEYVVVKNTTGSSVSYSGNSWINGNIRRYIDNSGANTDLYGFPVGDGNTSSDYHLVEMTNGNLTGGGFTYLNGKFGALANHNDADLSVWEYVAEQPYTSVCSDGVWFLDADNQPATGTYDMKAYFTNFGCALTDNQFGLLKRSSGSATAADWACTPCGIGNPGYNPDGGDGRMVADGYVIRYGFSGFSQFGVGTAPTPLPLELLSFKANCDQENVKLTWTTASEVNTDYFVISRSIDGGPFVDLQKVSATGNSNGVQTYELKDNYGGKGTAFYRLSLVNMNGKVEELGVVSTPSCYDNYINVTVINAEKVQVSLRSDIDQTLAIELYDVTGKLINMERKGFTAGYHLYNFVPNVDLAKGMYFISIRDSKGNQFNEKVYLQKR